MLKYVGMGAEVGGSDPAAEHDSGMRRMVSISGPTSASTRRINPGFILQHDPPPARLQPADDRLSPLIRPRLWRIRPKRARFVTACARFVTFWVFWLLGER